MIGIPLADQLARKYFRSGEPPDDLRQVARLGLIKAVDRFNPARGDRFIAYAVPTINGELKRYFRDTCWVIRVPRQIQEAHLRVRATYDELTQRLSRDPTDRELAHELDMSLPIIRLGGHADDLYSPKSINHPSGTEPSGTHDVAELLGDVDPGIESVDVKLTVQRVLATLPTRQRNVIYLRFFCNLDQAEIARQVGISQMHVSRLIRLSLNRLEHQLVG